MIIYGLMKYVENIPGRYDKVMDLLTAGNFSRAHKIILSNVKPGMRVLDIGCGTGKFSLECARLGAQVYAIDSSLEMLRIFREKIRGTSLEKNITIIECGVGSIKEVLGENKFDLIVASLMLGELPTLVRSKTIAIASELLNKNGKFIISDELWPENAILSTIYHILFWIFFIPNFLLTRTLIRPVKGLYNDIERSKLVVTEKTKLFGGVITVLNTSRRPTRI